MRATPAHLLAAFTIVLVLLGCSGNAAPPPQSSPSQPPPAAATPADPVADAGTDQVNLDALEDTRPLIAPRAVAGIYVCERCNYVYDPAKNGGVSFTDLPADWKCPKCGAPKSEFVLQD